ncbi:MAG: Dabb family protein [Bacteroidota bacterium]
MRHLFLLLVVSFLTLTACNQVDPQLQAKVAALESELAETEKQLAAAAEDEATFIHTVFFWMKEAVSEEQKSDFMANGLKALSEIPSIYRIYYGPPANTPREVVDNSYTFALVCHFKDAAAQDAYQEDPIHLKFIEDYKELWDRVQVYDNFDRSK